MHFLDPSSSADRANSQWLDGNGVIDTSLGISRLFFSVRYFLLKIVFLAAFLSGKIHSLRYPWVSRLNLQTENKLKAKSIMKIALCLFLRCTRSEPQHSLFGNYGHSFPWPSTACNRFIPFVQDSVVELRKAIDTSTSAVRIDVDGPRWPECLYPRRTIKNRVLRRPEDPITFWLRDWQPVRNS